MHSALTGAASHCEMSIPEAFAPRPDDGLPKRTVDFHFDNARTKFDAATRVEAAIKAATGHLIESR
jgi:hypothetical protein